MSFSNDIGQEFFFFSHWLSSTRLQYRPNSPLKCFVRGFSFLLCLALHTICAWEALDVLLDIALVSQELNICTVDQNTTLLLQPYILLPSQRGETPVLADNDLLSAGELVHRSSQGLDGGGAMAIKSADGKKDLANVDTSNGSVWLAPSATHSGLQSIGTGA
jgi:hypothetical protein